MIGIPFMETMYKKYENKSILPVRPFPKIISMANHMAWYSFAYAIKQWHYGHRYALIQKKEQNTMTFLFVKKDTNALHTVEEIAIPLITSYKRNGSIPHSRHFYLCSTGTLSYMARI